MKTKLMKHISILLAVLMILSSLSLLSASAKTLSEDLTGSCTQDDETFKMEFANELSRYSFEIGFNEPYPIDGITVFREDHKMYVFGLSDMLCTVGGEDIEGYRFENPIWYGVEKNKSGYCVYDGSKIYGIKDAVEEKIVTVEFLASVIPHTTKINEEYTDPTADSSAPVVEPALSLSNAVELIKAYIEEEKIAVMGEVNADYVNTLRVYAQNDDMIVFGLEDAFEAFRSETIGGYVFENPLCFGGENNKTGLCVYDGNKIYGIKDAVENKIVDVEFLASVIPNTKLLSSVRADLQSFLTIHCWDLDWYNEELYTPESFMVYKGAFSEANKICYDMSASDEQLQEAYDEVVEAYHSLVSLLSIEALEAFKTYIKDTYPDYDLSKAVALGEAGYGYELIYGYGYEQPVEGGEINIGGYKIWAPATTPFQSAGLFVYKDNTIKTLKDAYADGSINEVNVNFIIALIKAADKSFSFKVTDLNEKYKLILSDSFINAINDYIDYLDHPYFVSGLTFGKVYIRDSRDKKCIIDELPDSGLNVYEGLSIYELTDSRVIFGFIDAVNAFGFEIIDGYMFENPEFYTNEKNITGLCVYEDGRIYSIKEAVEQGVVTAEYLASIIPGTTKTNEPQTNPTTSEQPASSDDSGQTPPETQPATYKISNAKASLIANQKYTGKEITPSIKVTYDGKILIKNKDYTLSYKNNKDVGMATVTIKGKGSYTGTLTKTFKIVKANNPIKVKTVVKTVKHSKLAKSKQTVNALKVTGAKGKVSCKRSSGSKFLTVSSGGKVSVKRGSPKGTYKIKVKVSASGDKNYKTADVTATVTIKVK